MTLPDTHIIELLSARFRLHVKTQPKKTACAFLGDGEYVDDQRTYEELDRRVCRLAYNIEKFTIPGQRAILLFPSGIDFLETFLACMYAGVVAVPLFPPRNQRYWNRLHRVLTDADASLILTTSSFLDKIRKWSEKSVDTVISSQTKILAIEKMQTSIEPDEWQPDAASPHHIALLQYTSGSTSAPKGVMVSHANLIDNLNILCSVFGLNESSIMVSWLPHYHDMGLIEGHLLPLFVGGTVYLMAPAAFLQQPVRWLRALTKFKATHTSAANFAFDLCRKRVSDNELTEFDLSNLRTVLNGAEPIRSETLTRFHDVFARCGLRATAMSPGYGLAESTLLITDSGGPAREPVTVWADTEELKKRNFKAADPAVGRALISSGKAAPGIDICISSLDNSQILPVGKIGEILLHGRSIAQGYWRAESATEETFKVQISGYGDKKFLRTGDLGFLDREGELFICGRTKDVIIIDGANHYPQDIELSATKAHNVLAPDAGAAVSQHINGGEHLVLIQEVRRTKRREVDPQSVFAAVAKAISLEHGLSLNSLILLRPGTIPKTSSGKIQRSLCLSKLKEGTHNIIAQWPEVKQGEKVTSPTVSISSLKIWITERVATTIGIPANTLRTNRPLAEYGLSSVNAVTLSGALENYLGQKLPSFLLYQYPTIDALCHFFNSDFSHTPETNVQKSEPVAIIGMACRFPGAKSVKDLWHLLKEKVDAICEAPEDRWDSATFVKTAISACKHGGFLQEVDTFDAAFFGISPREAVSMDPQQRLLLEISWEALENAGQPPSVLKDHLTGVFVGIGTNDYAMLQREGLEGLDVYHATGNSNSLAANRISYFLDLKGPSIAIDTACSSSLVAVHKACQSLQYEESDIALAAGVNLILAPDLTIVLAGAQMLSSSGCCRTFDKDADGYVRSEGCGAVVLKRLEHAIRDGDRIHAVIRGSAINHGGRSNGITAPTVQGQAAVIQAALNKADIRPSEVDFIEAHGTGTPLGDPIEMEALTEVLGGDRAKDNPVWVGSVKTNIGHLEAAAGIAGLIKSTLALQHKILPPQLHFHRLNPDIYVNGSLRVADREISFHSSQKPLVCGVSSFGFGGANAHVILEEFPAAETDKEAPSRIAPPSLLVVSAAGRGALKERAGMLADFLKEGSQPDFSDLVYSLNTKSEHLPHRAIFIASSVKDFTGKLDDFAQARKQPDALGQAFSGAGTGAVFVFSGQGTQWLGMGKELASQSAVFRASLEQLDSYIGDSETWSIFDALVDEKLSLSPERLQPTLCALQIGLVNMLQGWGVIPSAVIGHSLGEISAACIAGALSEKEALRVATERGRVMNSVCNSGGMLATSLSAADLEKHLNIIGGGLEMAVANSRRSSVASGPDAALEKLRGVIEDVGEQAVRLKGNISFHHSVMIPLQPQLQNVLEDLKPSIARLPLVSTVDGSYLPERLFDGHYWASNIRRPVLFAEAVETLLSQGYRHFIEIGPHPALAGHIEAALAGRNHKRILAVMSREKADITAPLRVAAALFADGLITPNQMIDEAPHRLVELPSYPWQRQRHWITTVNRGAKIPSDQNQQWQKCKQAASRQSNFVPIDLSLEVYDSAWEALNQLALADMELALRRLNGNDTLSLNPRVTESAVKRQYQGLVQRWYQVLSDSGRIKEKNDVYQIVGKPTLPDRLELVKKARNVTSGFTFLTDYVVRCGDQVVDILQGRGEALETLFPKGTWQTVEKLYHDWSVPRYFNAIIGEILQSLSSSAAPLRIIEVGGGTGGTTRSLLPTLQAHQVEYKFTDISPYFIEPMRQKFSDVSFLSCGVFDLDIPPEAQGYQENSYDVVIGANSLHAVKDLPKTLQNLQRLLTHDGILIIYEVTRLHPWLDTSVALIEGWGNVKDDQRANCPLLSPSEWGDMLMENGFEEYQSFPSHGSPADMLGQHVITARTSGVMAEKKDDVIPKTASWLYELHWQQMPLKNPAHQQSKTLLLLCGKTNTAELLKITAEAAGCNVIQCHDLRDLLTVDKADHIVHLLNLECGEMGLEEAFIHGLYSAQKLLRKIVLLPERQRPKLWFVTSGSCQVSGERGDPRQAPVLGWARSVANELPGVMGGFIDVDPQSDDVIRAQQVFAEIISGGGEPIALRSGQRFVCRLEEAGPFSQERRISVRPDGLYLITGGLGVLGKRIARYLSDEGAGGLILLSRRARSDSLTETALEAVASIEAEGTTVHLVCADIADESVVKNALDAIETETGKKICGVVHAAGALDTAPLNTLDEGGLKKALHAKAHGAWTLHNIFCRKSIDFFVLFGSASSVLPPPSNAAYAASNAFLDCLSAYRRVLNLPAVTISWGSWEEAGGKAQKTVENLKRMSLEQITFAEGLSFFERLGASHQSHWVVLPGDLRSWQQISSLCGGVPLQQPLEIKAPLHSNCQKNTPKKKSDIEDVLRSEITVLMNMQPEMLDKHRPLIEQGLDSLMTVGLKGRIEHIFGVSIPVSTMIAKNSLSDLAGLIVSGDQMEAADATFHQSKATREVINL